MPDDLADEEAALLDAFERVTLSAERFRHRDHVHVAWLYLRRCPAAEAVSRFEASLRRFAAALGKPDLYHETITWAFLLLIADRRARAPQASWREFEEANPDLFRKDVLLRYYHEETLRSSLARRTFLFPDRVAAPGARDP
jgi:hypothetical protein